MRDSTGTGSGTGEQQAGPSAAAGGQVLTNECPLAPRIPKWGIWTRGCITWEGARNTNS